MQIIVPLFIIFTLFSGCADQKTSGEDQHLTRREVSEPAEAIQTPLPFGTFSLPDLNGPQIQAEIGGALSLLNGCLYLEVDDHRSIPIFPAEHTRWDSEKMVLTIVDTEIMLHEEFRTNGGYRIRSANIHNHLVHPIPDTCVGDEIVDVLTQGFTN